MTVLPEDLAVKKWLEFFECCSFMGLFACRRGGTGDGIGVEGEAVLGQDILGVFVLQILGESFGRVLLGADYATDHALRKTRPMKNTCYSKRR